MDPVEMHPALLEHRTLLLQFRWLLFLWLGATLAVLNNRSEGAGTGAFAPLALMLLSQLVLWRLPLRYLEGMKVYYAVFLFDLMLILLNLVAAGQMHQDLLIAFFASIFVAALLRRVGASFVAAVLLGGAYWGLKSRASGGFDLSDTGPLLDLPFLLIASIHSVLVAQAAETEIESHQRLLADNGALSRKVKNAFFESTRFNQSIKALLDTLPFAMVMLDRANEIRLFNAPAELAFGILRKNVLGTQLERCPQLACLTAALDVQEKVQDGGFQWMAITSAEGDPMQMVLGTYFVCPEDGAPMGRLLILMPFPYHQAMDQFVRSVPMDDRMPTLARAAAPWLPLSDPTGWMQG